ncbi:MAG: 1-(5-phosphoribosyl)-5-[(5-phosphoribosylamino)methylideneamino]imidazole-4-carboxamide isomerase [Candidatus Hydrogenedentes bacterium]|nr:1-(5-phosphoribosyl)-5-[(5-phosphoribosylamino)methylideneamino]imidazole-4-carboxamide isomerase [Candidatus Hydrogenedentota bacterium]
MRIVPAVDIRGGRCVNLVQGDYDRETVFSNDPVAQARQWQAQGAELVHIVDLDGAKNGQVCVHEQLSALADANVSFEIGGGIRTVCELQEIIELGASRVILGTAAHRDPNFLHDAATRFPGRVVAGIDAKAGKVALDGWLDVTETDAVEFARRVEEAGAARIIYTDILSDGMMKGPNLRAILAVAKAVHIPVTASGGISSLEDIHRLRAFEIEGVDEVIVGRALYLRTFTLAEAIQAAQGPT